MINKLLNFLKFAYPFFAFSASIRKSNYLAKLDWISSTKCSKGKSNAVYNTQLMTQCIIISGLNCLIIFGFCIFTATSRPSFNLALWTCANDADAIGYSLNSMNAYSTDIPTSSLNTFLILSIGDAFALSCNLLNHL